MPASNNVDKILRNKYFNLADSACFAGQEPLIRKVRKKFRRPQVKTWLQAQDAYTLHVSKRKTFPRNKYIVNNIDDLWQLDLAVFKNLAPYNDGYKYLLVAIDVFSKYTWVRVLRKKTGKEVNEALESIFKSDKRKPQNIQSDKGKEFISSLSKSFFKAHDINFYTTRNPDTKAAVVERVLRTLKHRLWRYFTYKNTLRYIDIIQAIVHGYNNTVHSSIKMPPAKVNDDNILQVWRTLYKKKEKYIKPKLKLGDNVRLSKEKKHFAKGYEKNWTEEVFTVSRVIKHPVPVYEVRDLSGDIIDGTFYEQELQKVVVPKNKVYKIEQILEMKGTGKNKKVFVKWAGYPTKFNSWVPASQIMDIIQ